MVKNPMMAASTFAALAVLASAAKRRSSTGSW